MTPLASLAGLEVRQAEALAGHKYAVQFGSGPVYVSPAVYDLIRHADPDELRRLLKMIPLRKYPDVPDLSGPWRLAE